MGIPEKGLNSALYFGEISYLSTRSLSLPEYMVDRMGKLHKPPGGANKICSITL